MAGEPNELPEGGEGGGDFHWGPIRGEFPQELPWIERSTVALLGEVFRVRDRLQRVENAQIAASVLGRGGGFAAAAFGVGGPPELPEGGEGGGGGFGGWRGEFPGEIAELPIDRIVLQQVAALEARFAVLEAKVAAALEIMEAQVKK
jgi:hypothetical protein